MPEKLGSELSPERRKGNLRRHKTSVTRKLPKQTKCPLCGVYVEDDLHAHILHGHGEEAFRRAVLAAKQQGMPDSEIGARFGISFGTLEQLITEAYGANVSVLRGPKPVTRWYPSDFREETTTVWSFKQRGDWATHEGRYRGNWSPYLPATSSSNTPHLVR